jgi:hypothetical protein
MLNIWTDEPIDIKYYDITKYRGKSARNKIRYEISFG